MIRGGLVGMLCHKTTDLSLRDIDPAASLTLMSADIERIVQGWQTMHEIWANPIEIAIAVYLLEVQLEVACVIPIAVSVGEYSAFFFPIFPPPRRLPISHFLTLSIFDF
jgi:ATP-binding cassette, subfamily C (CFTR/MRP), member 1